MDKTTIDLGASAEADAVAALLAADYEIVHRNWECDVGELDVVARDRGVLVFVEVRFRHDGEHGHAAEMITPGKRARVTRVARAYLADVRPDYDECRFDVVAVTGSTIDIIQDAWRIGGH